MQKETPQQVFTNTRSYVRLVFVGALISLLIVGVVYVWMSSAVKNTFTQIGSLNTDLMTLVNANAHAKTVRSLVRDTVISRTVLEEYFVDEHTVVTFLEDIKSLGATTGVAISVSSVRPGNSLDKDETLEPLTITLDTEGSFSRSVHFLALLEQYPKVLYVSSARITQDEEGWWNGLFTINLTRIMDTQL